MRRLLFLALVLVAASCGGAAGTFAPVSPERLGQIIPGAQGAPDIECRAIDINRCVGIGVLPDEMDQRSIERVIVSCEGSPCTLTDGAFRIDTVDKAGKTTEIGRGGYGDATQPTPPPAAN